MQLAHLLLTTIIALLLAHVTLLPQSAPSVPDVRGGHSMTYDDARGVALMFGGGNRQRTFNDLWEWDGRRWQILSTSGPSARDSAVLAFDSKRQKAILHGGRAADGLRDDTWEWDGTRWTERPIAGPGLRLHHAGAYDPRRGRLVIYGGLRPVDKTVRPLTDTWEYDGETWTRRDTVGVDVFVCSMTFDPQRGQVVLLGVEGMTEREGTRQTAMWTWDGTRWSRVTSGFGEPALSPMPPLTPTATGLLLMDGGIAQGNTAFTWLWRGDRWTRADAAPPAPQRVSHALAYDSRRKRVVMFGGHSGFGPGRTGEMYGDTWEWSGDKWERVDPK